MKVRRSQRGMAMRSVFLLLGLAAVAVALALLMGDNQATFSLFWPPYRFDVSFNFVLFVLVATFVVIHLALRGLSVLRDLPSQARRWRDQQVERGAVAAVLDALSHQLAGRFVRAQSAALQALEQLNGMPSAQWSRRQQLQLLAHLLAAESAQALQNRSSRDTHLQAALHPTLARSAPEAHEGALLRAVRWAVEDRRPETARHLLAELPQGTARRIQALRLKLRVARMSGETLEALEVARLLAKHRAFSPEVAGSVVRGLAMDALRDAHDLSQLQAVWSRLDTGEQAMPELILAAAARLNGLVLSAEEPGADSPDWQASDREMAFGLLWAWTEPLWAHLETLGESQWRDFVRALEPGLPHLDAAGLGRLEQAQRQWPSNPFLQYLAGQAFKQRQLWGKSAQLLGQASHSLQDTTLLRRTWCALAQLAEERGDDTAAQAAWKKAAQID